MKSKFNNIMNFIYAILQLLAGALTIWATYELDMEAYWYLGGVALIIWGIFGVVKYFKNRKEKTPEE